MHRIIKINKKNWLKSYIDMTTDLRGNAKETKKKKQLEKIVLLNQNMDIN